MTDNTAHGPDGEARRDFLYLTTAAVATVGTVAAVWPLIHQMNPARDVLALASTEVDLSAIEIGQSIKVMWRGKPVFVRHRTAEEIAEAKAVPLDDLRDPQLLIESRTALDELTQILKIGSVYPFQQG